ncbi:hypothetical protein C8R44DRAFT_988036 [Mycena epipterygia]|nr:hypothetical protein C8R44DRAFT_988036 [Mycena epipterygia]
MPSLPPNATPNDESTRRLPPELIQLILEHLRSEPETLRRTALVSKQWLPTSRVHLFNHVCLSAPHRGSTRTPCSLLYDVISESPELAYYIRHVSILAGSTEWANVHPRTRWIVAEDTLSGLLHILARSSRVESVQIRLSGEHWHALPEPLQTSILTFIDSPSMRDVDLTGFDVVDGGFFGRCRSIKRLKLSEIGDIQVGAAEADVWPTRCDSVTVLDTVRVANIISWVIATPYFCVLREVRLGFDPLDDVAQVEALLSHVSDTLESLHLQPIHQEWSSLPWAAFLLSTLSPTNRLTHLTIDLLLHVPHHRPPDRDGVRALPWAVFDAALGLPHLAQLHTLEVTCFASTPGYPLPFVDSPDIAAWLLNEVSRLLPFAHARDVFGVYQLKFSPSHFFYWPGPLNWCRSFGMEDGIKEFRVREQQLRLGKIQELV